MAIVVSGMGVVTALGVGIDINLEALRQGRDGIGAIHNFTTQHHLPSGELRLTNEQLQQQLGIDPRKTTSRTTLLGITAAQEALADAKLLRSPKLARTAFISATTVGGMDLTPRFYNDFATNPSRGRLRYVVQHDCSQSTHDIAKHCGIGGYSTAISTACSSSINAIAMAVRLLEQGYIDIAVAGGVDALSLYTLNGFNALMILAHDKCRPFCDTRTGLNLGEGAAYLVLQRHSDAQQAHCQILGYANAGDAHHQTAMTNEGVGAQKAMTQALQAAHLRPEDIDYINLHGTATHNNDASEAQAIEHVFKTHVPPLSSTKPYTGHTLAACGAIETIYSALALKHQCIWPNLNFQQPMKETNIVPVTTLTTAKLQHVMTNSFGFGGNCSSLILGK